MNLLSALSAAIGRRSARQELKWMKQALAVPNKLPDLPTMVARRVAGEPLQYILGAQPFGPLTLLARAPVLIPRPETEDWALRLAARLAPSPRMPAARLLDLCTGSACIPLLFCATWPPATVHATAVDVSEAALALAGDNARLCGVPLVPLAPTLASPDALDTPPLSAPQNTLTLLRADALAPAALAAALRAHAPFDILTANPPYIPRSAYAALPRSVRAFEDPAALLGDPPGARADGGLAFYRALAALVARGGVLRRGGTLALEVGCGQARAVEGILRAAAPAIAHTEIWADPWGVERVVVAGPAP